MRRDWETLQLCDRFFDAIEQKDREALASCYAPEAVVWHSHDGLYQSREDNLAMLEQGMLTQRKVRFRNRRIRTFERPGYAYVIMLTAKTHKGEVIEGLNAGADDFVSKPFDRDELRVRLRTGERIVTLRSGDAPIVRGRAPSRPRVPPTGTLRSCV